MNQRVTEEERAREGREGGSRAALRALRLLDVLVDEPRGLGLSDAARRAGLSKATAYRLLGTLCEAGLAVQDAASARYRPSMKLVRMAGRILHGLLHTVALPFAEGLAREIGHSLYVGTIEGEDVVFLDVSPAATGSRIHTEPGQRRAIDVSSIGKVMLACLAEAEVERIVAACPFDRRTERTITDRAEYLALLDAVRRRGWALVRDEDAVGASSISAPYSTARTGWWAPSGSACRRPC